MRKLAVFVITLIAMPLVAGLYGALHDQVSFSISPEYFTRFKYEQFGFEPQWFGGDRPTVAVIGFLATWWVGALIGLFLGGTALFQRDARTMRQALVRATAITLGVALLCAIAGLIYGWWFIHEIPSGWYVPDDLQDLVAFRSVGSMHNCSYGGGVLGLIIALFDMEWRRNLKRERQGLRRALRDSGAE